MNLLNLATVKRLRTSLYDSQREAGLAAGFAPAVASKCWNQIERGKVPNMTAKMLARVAKTLDVEPWELLKP